MKKKTRATASRAAKRPKSGGRRAQKPRAAPAPAADTPAAGGASDAKATIRRLKARTGQDARREIEELQASADTDFLLDIPNRRGFERELSALDRLHQALSRRAAR